ncbi:MAG: leucyl aminopeptidase [Micavibrio sp.]|nr:leucyl aminopeptidase [Micavibrio sp.]
MTLNIIFSKSPKNIKDTLILPVYEGKKTIGTADFLNNNLKKTVNATLKKQKSFTGKKDEIYVIPTPTESDIDQIILAGLGDKKEFKALNVETLGGKLWPILKQHKCDKVYAFTSHLGLAKKNDEAELAAHLSMGLKLRSYNFDTYKTDSKKNKLPKITFGTTAQNLASALYKELSAAADGVFIARDLMNEPPNNLYPASYVSMVRKDLKSLGIEIEVFDEKKMEKLGFHSHLAVGMGSARKPRVLIMRWNGLPKSSKAEPIAFIGKGVTFDTGGISIKPGPGMEDMKMDMGGSAAVVGLMKSLAARKAKANVVGIVGLAENMPSSNAYRPGDIIKSMDGKTIEVLNTDAEGRLVLIDALTYIQKTIKPKMMIDLATLTGAMMVALGTEYCGAFVNQDKLWDQLNEASSQSGEKLWRMPLDKAYKDEMKSKIADLKNLGGRFGGACSAAGFLQHFIKDDKVAWAHLDIAGKMIHKSDSATVPAGGIGFGVRVLDRLVANNYEKK